MAVEYELSFVRNESLILDSAYALIRTSHHGWHATVGVLAEFDSGISSNRFIGMRYPHEDHVWLPSVVSLYLHSLYS